MAVAHSKVAYVTKSRPAKNGSKHLHLQHPRCCRPFEATTPARRSGVVQPRWRARWLSQERPGMSARLFARKPRRASWPKLVLRFRSSHHSAHARFRASESKGTSNARIPGLTLNLNLKPAILTVSPTLGAKGPLSKGTQLCWTVPVPPPTHRPEKPRPPHEPGSFFVRQVLQTVHFAWLSAV
jgi:hypothetical protein